MKRKVQDSRVQLPLSEKKTSIDVSKKTVNL